MAVKYRLRGNRAALMLPFAHAKLAHMRRYSIPMDGYRDNEYFIHILHDVWSGIDQIHITYKKPQPMFWVNRIMQRWGQGADVQEAQSNIYVVDPDRKTKKWVYTAQETNHQPSTYIQPRFSAMYSRGDGKATLSKQTYDHPHSYSGIEAYVLRRVRYSDDGTEDSYPDRACDLNTSNVPYTEVRDIEMNMNSPDEVELVTLLPTQFENTNSWNHTDLYVEDDYLYAVVVISEAIPGNPLITQISGWLWSHTGRAYIARRNLEAVVGDPNQYEIVTSLGTWTEDISLPQDGTTPHTAWTQPAYMAAYQLTGAFARDVHPCYTSDAIYYWSLTTQLSNGTDNNSLDLVRWDRTTQIISNPGVGWTRSWSGTGYLDPNGEEYKGFLWNQTDNGELLGYIYHDDSMASSEAQVWIGYENDLLDSDDAVKFAGGFENAQLLFTIDMDTYTDKGPGAESRRLTVTCYEADYGVDADGVYYNNSKYMIVIDDFSNFDGASSSIVLYDAEDSTFTHKRLWADANNLEEWASNGEYFCGEVSGSADIETFKYTKPTLTVLEWSDLADKSAESAPDSSLEIATQEVTRTTGLKHTLWVDE